VSKLIFPEPWRTPVPDTMETLPPILREEDVDPATMFTEPPSPAAEEPERIFNEPAEPPDEKPEEIRTEPDELKEESPVPTKRAPLVDEEDAPENTETWPDSKKAEPEIISTFADEEE